MTTRFLRLCAAALAAVGFLALAPRASAETVDVLHLNLTPPNTDPHVTPFNGNGLNGGGPFTWTQSPINTNFATSFSTYCIDFNTPITSGTFITHTDLTQAPTIGNGTAANNNLKVGEITKLYDHFYSSSFSSATNEAAFQLALWELVYDGPNNADLDHGQVQAAPGAIKTAAQGMLSGSSYNGTEHDLANAYLVALVPDATKPPDQAQIVVVPKGVPAPPAALLAGFGVLALFGRARWNRKKTAPAA